MKQDLRLGLQTQLTLTPQLQQSIRLLQLSALEFNQEIGEILQQNPLLERMEGAGEAEEGAAGEDFVPDMGAVLPPTPMTTTPPAELVRSEPAPDYSYEPVAPDTGRERDAAAEVRDGQEVSEDLAWGGRTSSASDDDDENGEFNLQDQAGTSLRQHLFEQVLLSPLSGTVRQRVSVLIESLDEDGYLQADLDELAEMLPEADADERENLDVALRVLQGLDPVGVGARDLSECLRLQLQVMRAETPWRDVALNLANSHLNLLADREYGKLRRALGLPSDRELAEVRALLASLNPRPGAAFTPADAQYVIPDVVVRKARSGWQVNLNAEAMPRLRVNALYAGILRQHGESPALATQLQEARWMVRSVQQRFETILRVARVLVQRQQGWLEKGDAGLRPLILRDVADELGLHESTISRATTQKYMLTPRGLIEFKRLFSNALATDDGEAASSQAIKALLKQMINEENRRQPLSDQALSDALGQQGFRVARRTVAKYREQMHIEPAAQRRILA